MKKLLSALLCLVLAAGLLPLAAAPSHAANAVSGTCGDSVIWTLNEAGLLTVKPMVTTQPKSVTVSAGGTATFVVGAAGMNQTYQWQQLVNGRWVGIPAGSDGYTGVTSHAMTVQAIPARNGYQYRCWIVDDNGYTASATVTLTVR